MRLRWVLAIGIGVMGWCAGAQAALLAYEGFNYTPGSLEGQSGGGSFGFRGGWHSDYAVIGQEYSVGSANLLDPTHELATSGGHCDNSNRQNQVTPIARGLSQVLGAPGSTRYMSFVGRFLYDSVADFNVLTPSGLRLEGTQQGSQFQTGHMESRLNQWGMLAIEPDTHYLSSAWAELPNPGDPVLAVLRVEFGSDRDSFSLYLNPAPGSSEPARPAATLEYDLGQILGISIVGDYRFSVDEIRVGETFADVTPIPEPSWVCALLIAAVLSARR